MIYFILNFILLVLSFASFCFFYMLLNCQLQKKEEKRIPNCTCDYCPAYSICPYFIKNAVDHIKYGKSNIPKNPKSWHDWGWKK